MVAATRVFVSVSPKSSHFNSAWDSPESVIRFALQILKDSNLSSWDTPPSHRFIAKERWHRIHIIFDIFNDAYTPQNAHLPGENDLPVIAVSLSGTSYDDQNKISTAPTNLRDEVNQTIRDFHNWHGNGSQAPFAVDHADGNIPTYPHPRTLIKQR